MSQVDIDIIHERTFTVPKVFENYIGVIAETNALVSILGKCNFDLAKESRETQENFKSDKLSNLEFRLAKNYVLLKEFITNSYINFKSLVEEVDLLKAQITKIEKNDAETIRDFEEQKESIRQTILEVNSNKKLYDSINDYIRHFNSSKEFNYDTQQVLDIFKDDEFIQENKDEVNLSMRSYKTAKNIDFSMEYLLKITELHRNQLNFVADMTQKNRDYWKLLSERVLKFSEMIKE